MQITQITGDFVDIAPRALDILDAVHRHLLGEQIRLLPDPVGPASMIAWDFDVLTGQVIWQILNLTGLPTSVGSDAHDDSLLDDLAALREDLVATIAPPTLAPMEQLKVVVDVDNVLKGVRLYEQLTG